MTNDLADRLFSELMNLGFFKSEPGVAAGALATITDFFLKHSPPRHGKKGTGAHYAKQMVKMNRTHQDIIDALEYRSAFGSETRIPLQELTMTVNHLRNKTGRKNIKDGTVSGRASELQGLGITSCAPMETKLVDAETMRFEDVNAKGWYLTSQRPLLEVKQ